MMNYTIVGGGRLARHFSHYFQSLDIPHTRWVRDGDSPFNSFDIKDAEARLKMALSGADCVLLLVSDHAITGLLEQYPFLHEKRLVHCSGSLGIEGVAGVHPLMTFSASFYEPDVYRSIPFIVEKGSDFKSLFPALPNPHHVIDIVDKARYHAMCVMAGNFVQLMWKSVSDQFVRRFDWPAEVLQPYLERIAGNFVDHPESALTGPLVRNDTETIDRNLRSLDNDPLQNIYHAFVSFYREQEKLYPDTGPNQVEQV